MITYRRRSSMPSCLVVSFLVILAAYTTSFHAAASSSNSRAHRTPTLRWKQRGGYNAMDLTTASKDPVDKWVMSPQRKV